MTKVLGFGIIPFSMLKVKDKGNGNIETFLKPSFMGYSRRFTPLNPPVADIAKQGFNRG